MRCVVGEKEKTKKRKEKTKKKRGEKKREKFFFQKQENQGATRELGVARAGRCWWEGPRCVDDVDPTIETQVGLREMTCSVRNDGQERLREGGLKLSARAGGDGGGGGGGGYAKMF